MTSAIYIYYTPSWQQLADIVLPRVKEYCEIYGYGYEVVCTDWSYLKVGHYKMHVLKQVLEKYEFVWVLDLDTLITNKEIPFTNFVDYHNDIFICLDIHGINAGSWIVRNTPESVQFINEVIMNFDAPEEQTVMKRYLHMVKMRILPHPSINSYMYGLYNEIHGSIEISESSGEWAPDHLLLHLPGLSFEKRIEILGGLI